MGTTASGGGRLLLSALLCLSLASPALAERQQLSLRQAVEIAISNNPQLASVREEQRIVDAGKVRAGLLPNPALEIEGGTGALTGSSAENNLSIGLSQEFLLGDKRHKRLAVADREAAAYRWQVAERERELKEQVRGGYYDALLAQERVALARQSVSLNSQLLQVAQDRLSAGDIPELELNLVKVELAGSRGEVVQMERARNEAFFQLSTLLALPPGEVPSLSETLEGGAPPSKTAAELKRLALDNRPDLKSLRESAGRGDAEVALAQSEVVPNLTAGVALSREATSMEIGGVEGRDTSYTIGVKLSIPIPVFDRNQAGLQEARARKASAEIRAKGAAAVVEAEVDAAFAGYASSEEVLSLYRGSILRQLEENLDLTREAYRLGEVGILAVIQEQKKYFEVRDSYLSALHARQMALVKLESAVAADNNGGGQ